MLQNPAGDEPEIELGVGRFRRRLVRHRQDAGLAVLVAVELDALAGLHIGVEALPVAPERLLAVDHRPAQPADLMVEVVGAEVMAMAAAEGCVFLEQALLHIEAEMPGLDVVVVRVDLARRKAIDLAVAKEHVEQGLALVVRVLVEQLRRPDLVGGEALGKLHQLPEVGAGLPRRVDELVPDMGAALGIAVGTFLLHPHRGGEDEVGGHGRHGRVGVGDDDEVLGVAIARIGLVAAVRRGLQVVVDLDPVEIELPVLEHAVLLDGVIARLLRDDPVRDAPDLLRMLAMLGVGHHHVGRQAVGEGADLARGAAGRGLPGQREGAVARLGDFSRQQMQVVDELVGPDAADVLVEAHRPERRHLALGVGVELGQLLQEAGSTPVSAETFSSV